MEQKYLWRCWALVDGKRLNLQLIIPGLGGMQVEDVLLPRFITDAGNMGINLENQVVYVQREGTDVVSLYKLEKVWKPRHMHHLSTWQVNNIPENEEFVNVSQ